MYIVTAQYAHHSHDESEELKRISTKDEALALFDEFDWESQAAEAATLKRVSPTLSIKSEDSNDLVWVSVVEYNAKTQIFVTDCAVQKGEKNYLFGLITRPNYVGSSNDWASEEAAKKTIEEFFDLRSSRPDT